jgi:hypothetical protein
MTVNRNKLREEFGVYMTDGLQIPALKQGMLTTAEAHLTIQKFFNSK